MGEGDPLTPGLPSLDGFYRINRNESALPPIPAHPISYGDAVHFLQNMTGDQVCLTLSLENVSSNRSPSRLQV